MKLTQRALHIRAPTAEGKSTFGNAQCRGLDVQLDIFRPTPKIPREVGGQSNIGDGCHGGTKRWCE